jgi:hypothetical protein
MTTYNPMAGRYKHPVTDAISESLYGREIKYEDAYSMIFIFL